MTIEAARCKRICAVEMRARHRDSAACLIGGGASGGDIFQKKMPGGRVL